MIPPLQRQILEKLAEVCELSDGIRFGQMMDFMGFLGQTTTDRPLVVIDDADLLAAIENHLGDLRRRKQSAIEVQV